jgi:hypothetical protein
MFVFVADYNKMRKKSSVKEIFYSATDGNISQNVYLYCTSANLANVVVEGIDRKVMSKTLKLQFEQKIILSQCGGIPAK